MPMNGRLDKEKCGTYTPWNMMQPVKKEQNHVLRSNVDATGDYCKQINTGTENQMPHVLTYKSELNIWYTRT